MDSQLVDISLTENIIEQFRGQKGAIIPMLQAVQEAYGYVPREAINLISKEIGIYPVQLYGVLTFYTQFRLVPRGKHTLKVCLGTACHVMGGKNIFDYLSSKLGVKAGDTTQDGIFTLERVACVGCCGMAPVLVIDDKTSGNCTIQNAEEMVEKYGSSPKKLVKS